MLNGLKIELLPCPCCGGEARLRTYRVEDGYVGYTAGDVGCTECGLRTRSAPVDGTFGLNDNVTIEQLSVILWNYMGRPEDDVRLDQIGTHSHWALNSLHWSIATKVFAEVPYDEVGDLAPRVQTVKMLTDYLK